MYVIYYVYPDIKAKETPAYLLHVQRAQSRAERKAMLEEERRISASRKWMGLY